jgi:hypothetical protein
MNETWANIKKAVRRSARARICQVRPSTHKNVNTLSERTEQQVNSFFPSSSTSSLPFRVLLFILKWNFKNGIENFSELNGKCQHLFLRSPAAHWRDNEPGRERATSGNRFGLTQWWNSGLPITLGRFSFSFSRLVAVIWVKAVLRFFRNSLSLSLAVCHYKMDCKVQEYS